MTAATKAFISHLIFYLLFLLESLMKTNNYFNQSKLYLCIASALSMASISTATFAAEDEDAVVMEEVVATASRLKGSAASVIEERKAQAFVADMLGSEQISRTGDSDAASALKRVTGLTLVGGKFIYVRGLGERYSSTSLNGANVPSPDPTRKVVPLDMFPAGIIENLSVQKAYSPNMSGEFGGGAIDIKTKSIPDEFVLNVSGSLGYNTENSDDGLSYSGGSRELPNTVRANTAAYGVINESVLTSSLGSAEAAQTVVDASVLSFTNSSEVRNESIDPDYGFGLSVGDRYDVGDHVFGFLFAAEYDDSWENSTEREVRFDTSANGINAIEDKTLRVTEHEEKLSAILNLGFDWGKDHKFETTSIYLSNSRDKVEQANGDDFDYDSFAQVTNLLYEERELISHQLRGMHNFPKLMNLGLDWQYSESSAKREAPDERQYVYVPVNGVDQDRLGLATDSITPGLTRFFSDLDDDAETFQWNASLPLFGDGYELEFKIGGDNSKKWRQSEGLFFQYLFKYNPDSQYLEQGIDSILSPDTLTSNNTKFQQLLRVDDYSAARMLDASYGQFDLFLNGKYRLSGGLRYEDWRQAVVPIGFESNKKQALKETTITDDILLPALSFTYIIDEQQQLRLGYGKTVVRPDLKELSPVRYLDPLTDNPVFGNPDLKITEIQNFDLRWEYYADTGDNLSLALFYKDLDAPIENVQLPGADESNISFINAQSGEIFGLELEWLKDLSFVGDGFEQFFVSGNVTLSDSEITIPDEYSYFSLANQALLPVTQADNAYVTNQVRRMTGHSEYVLNLQLGYDSNDGEHSASLVYNVSGERIMAAGIDNMPDLMEEPLQSLDLVYTYYPTFETKINFKLKNILDQNKEFTRDGQIAREISQGTAASLSFSWDM